VSSQSTSAVSGTFEADCAGGVIVSGSGSGQLASSTTVSISISGVANLPGAPSCGFSLSGNGTVEDAGTALRIPYAGTTCLGPVHGTEVLRKSSPASPAPSPTPTPVPEPTPTPQPSGPGDAIDLHGATILNSPRDIANWPITTTIDRLDVNSGGFRVEFSKKDGGGRWPDVTPPGWDGPLQYTLGMVLNIGGRWYASAAIEFWYGLDRSGGAPSQVTTNWFYDPIRWNPMTYHQPAVGEQVGFYVCEGDCRNNLDGSLSPLRERSNVVVVPYPSDGGAAYSFSAGSRLLSAGSVSPMTPVSPVRRIR
jgi:hypothetical protein